jgi:hypothetical protein
VQARIGPRDRLEEGMDFQQRNAAPVAARTSRNAPRDYGEKPRFARDLFMFLRIMTKVLLPTSSHMQH